jgi:hypothetical protein
VFAYGNSLFQILIKLTLFSIKKWAIEPGERVFILKIACDAHILLKQMMSMLITYALPYGVNNLSQAMH